MINVTGFLHHEYLGFALEKALLNQFYEVDVAVLKEVVNFNSFLGQICLDQFAEEIYTQLFGSPPSKIPIQSKRELKDRLIQSPHYYNDRIYDLLAHYVNHPENFYGDTPIDGMLYEVNNLFVGSSRIKRFRRISEKAGRKIIEFIFKQIKIKADILAEQRAKEKGITKQFLITPEEDMVLEFSKSEQMIKDHLKNGMNIFDGVNINIEDALGMKLIGDSRKLQNLIKFIHQNPRMQLLEEEYHTGKYTATNLIVRYTYDRERLLGLKLTDDIVDILKNRGMDPLNLESRLHKFILDASDSVHVEIIVCDYHQMLESEIGDTMHEERIFNQRNKLEYQGAIAKNVEYLLEYLFAFCLSPATEIKNFPIRLWVKYLPDYMDKLLQDLYNIRSQKIIFSNC
jgi:hypothetical protein